MRKEEKIKNEVEEIILKNKIISDKQIQDIKNKVNFTLEEKYVKKSEMVTELEKEKNYIKTFIAKVSEEIHTKYNDWFVGENSNFIQHNGNIVEKELNDFLEQKNIRIAYSEGMERLKIFERNLNQAYIRISKEEEGIIKGEEGEKNISNELKLYNQKYKYRENIIIPANDIGGETSETDIYIVTAKGVFVCEVKNWGKRGRTICISKDGQWSVKRRKIVLKSPVQQNTRHCLATERFLENNGLSKV